MNHANEKRRPFMGNRWNPMSVVGWKWPLLPLCNELRLLCSRFEAYTYNMTAFFLKFLVFQINFMLGSHFAASPKHTENVHCNAPGVKTIVCENLSLGQNCPSDQKTGIAAHEHLMRWDVADTRPVATSLVLNNALISIRSLLHSRHNYRSQVRVVSA